MALGDGDMAEATVVSTESPKPARAEMRRERNTFGVQRGTTAGSKLQLLPLNSRAEEKEMQRPAEGALRRGRAGAGGRGRGIRRGDRGHSCYSHPPPLFINPPCPPEFTP